jgi:hypothetical protein
MDLHRALNHLCADHAEEVIFGAHVYGLLPQDRPAIEAFMRGLNATRQLKFDHPGLATTATRSGTRLVIQNDIGETDAHVVVIAVEGDAVTMTYTDVHLIRACSASCRSNGAGSTARAPTASATTLSSIWSPANSRVRNRAHAKPSSKQSAQRSSS